MMPIAFIEVQPGEILRRRIQGTIPRLRISCETVKSSLRLPEGIMFDLVVAATLAFAAEKGGDTPPVGPAGGAVAQAKPDDEIVVKGQKPKERRTICRIETPTGTSFSKRICRTAAQVEGERAQSARLINEAGRIQTLQATTDRDNGPK